MAKPLIIENYRLERFDDFIHVKPPTDRVTVLAYYEYQEPGVEVLRVTNESLDGPADHGWTIESIEAIDGGLTAVVHVGKEEAVFLSCRLWFTDSNDQKALRYGQVPRERSHRVTVNLVNKPTIDDYAEALGDSV